MIFGIIIAGLASTASLQQTNAELLLEDGSSRDQNSASAFLPSQTLRDYLDHFISGDQSTLSERSIYRTQTFTEVIWTDGNTIFNISMSRCVNMSDIAGFYTAKIGDLPNATVQDIVDDLQVRGGSEAANRAEYSSRVEENAELTIVAANDLLKLADPYYTPISTTDQNYAHGELRHLLALAEMTVIIVRSSLVTEILVSFFAGIMGRITGGTDYTGVAIYCIIMYSLQVAIGIHNLMEGQRVNFVTATIFNIFLSWVRDSIRELSAEFLPDDEPSYLPSVAYEKLVHGYGNGTVRGHFPDGSRWPLAQDLVKNAMEAMGYLKKPQGRFRSSLARLQPANCKG